MNSNSFTMKYKPIIYNKMGSEQHWMWFSQSFGINHRLYFNLQPQTNIESQNFCNHGDYMTGHSFLCYKPTVLLCCQCTWFLNFSQVPSKNLNVSLISKVLLHWNSASIGRYIFLCLWLALCTVEEHVGILFWVMSPFQVNWRDTIWENKNSKLQKPSLLYIFDMLFFTGVRFIWPLPSCKACSQDVICGLRGFPSM